MTHRIEELQRLHDGWAMDGDAEGWHCKGCGKLHTRCRCPDMVFEALPALLRVARAAQQMRKAMTKPPKGYGDEHQGYWWTAATEKAAEEVAEAVAELEKP